MSEFADWYKQLRKPPLSPPAQIFRPVWSVLYAMILMAGWNLYRTKHSFWAQDYTELWIVYGLQWFLNLAWTPVFFGLRKMWLAVLVIVLLDILVWLFVSHTLGVIAAGWLMIPYFAWILFATYLNIGFAYLNQ